MSFEIKDSGVRESFGTGSVRDTEDGKGRYDLIPRSAVHRLAQHYQNGAKKYGDRNWERGQSMSRVVSSLLRHAFQYQAGDRDEDHLSAVAWNSFVLIHHEEAIKTGQLPSTLADLPWMKPGKYDPFNPVTFKSVVDHSVASYRYTPEEAAKVPPVNPIPFRSVVGTPEQARAVMEVMNGYGPPGVSGVEAVHKVMEENRAKGPPSGVHLWDQPGIKDGVTYTWDPTKSKFVTAEERSRDKKNEQLLLYVAGPYRDPRGTYYVEQNIQRAAEVGRQLWNWGYSVIVPHLNTRHLDDGTNTAEVFLKGDKTQIARCDAVVFLPRWRYSTGSLIEYQFCVEHKIPCVGWYEGITRAVFEANLRASLKNVICSL